jgi:hypothetical protein
VGLIHYNDIFIVQFYSTEKCDFMPRSGILLMMTKGIKQEVRESANSKRNYEGQRIL